MADKEKDASDYLGGMSGSAAKAIKTRGQRLKEAEDAATGGSSPNTNSDKGSDGNGRPEQRKRWFE